MTTLAEFSLGRKARTRTPFADKLRHFLQLLEDEWRRTIRQGFWMPEDLERQRLIRAAHVALGTLLDRQLVTNLHESGQDKP
jgi:hypothetical protein